jgi:hypothetical protein
MTPTPPLDAREVEKIAEGLTAAQRGLVVSAPVIGPKEPRRSVIELCALGLGDCTIQGDDEGERWVFTLTPLGLAVRQHLQDRRS